MKSPNSGITRREMDEYTNILSRELGHADLNVAGITEFAKTEKTFLITGSLQLRELKNWENREVIVLMAREVLFCGGIDET